VDSGHNKGSTFRYINTYILYLTKDFFCSYGVEKYFISQINKSLLRTVDPNKSVIFFIPVKLCAGINHFNYFYCTVIFILPAKWNLPPLPQPKKIKNILGRKLSAQYFYKVNLIV
jgi:hypothetical protein